MKNLISIITIIFCFVTISYATENDNDMNVTSVNNNYLGIGTPGEIQRSEAKVNGQIQAMMVPMVIPGEYNNVVYTDNKWQPEILEYILNIDTLKKFTIESPKCFVSKTTKSSYTSLFDMDDETEIVYVFKDDIDMKKNLQDARLIGYTNSYSTSDEDLMSCLNQNIINAGKIGGNVIVILKYNFIIGTESTTIGLGSSGVTGLLGGRKQASTFGAAIGWAKGKAKPVTYPYMHCMIFHSKTIETLIAFENK